MYIDAAYAASFSSAAACVIYPTQTRYEVQEYPGGDGGSRAREIQETHSHRSENPSDPDCPSKAAEFRDHDAHDDRGRGHGECLRQSADAGDDSTVALDTLIVEWKIVD